MPPLPLRMVHNGCALSAAPPAGRAAADNVSGGVAVKPGEEGVATVDLKSGGTYAFVCAIPDVLGDFARHLTKGMFTPPFTGT
ncbi:MAG: hypothetical protein M3P34_06905 [Actinomycetota bacterium]|nr:hypothetical protein [Actinomycetota bacterium]